MDDSHFDNLARSLASPTRRAILRRLAGAMVGSMLVPAIDDAAAHDLTAKCKKFKGDKKKKCLKKAKKHNASHTVAPSPTTAPGPCAGVQCIDQGPASCGTNGVCVGGVCQKYGSTTPCRSASCSGGVETLAATCDGNGNCPLVQNSCAPHDCGATACKRAGGSACDVDNECQSNVCGGGVCCNDACAANNATPNCVPGTGACFLTCNDGWGNCDGNAANGCETSLNNNEQNCGECGNSCFDECGGVGICFDGFCDCH